MDWTDSLIDDMRRYIGQTVTIFTTSGGLSGCGFTGVLISIDCKTVKLICNIGWAPACPIGSNCTNAITPYGIANNSGYGGRGGCGGYGGCGGCGGYGGCGGNYRNGYGNPLGSVTVIPTCAIASFTHNAI